jgi:hypothetical protein
MSAITPLSSLLGLRDRSRRARRIRGRSALSRLSSYARCEVRRVRSIGLCANLCRCVSSPGCDPAREREFLFYIWLHVILPDSRICSLNWGARGEKIVVTHRITALTILLSRRRTGCDNNNTKTLVRAECGHTASAREEVKRECPLSASGGVDCGHAGQRTSAALSRVELGLT